MASTCDWAGHCFYVYDPDNTIWYNIGGIYIFAGVAEHTLKGPTWRAYYIGETQDFSERIPGHEQWDEACQPGATHVHSMTVSDSHLRRAVEKFLVQEFDPPLNREYLWS